MKECIIKFILVINFTFMIGTLSAQTDNFNPIHTAVSSLTIAPDARGGSMGDVGVATRQDVYSQYWNPAKYAFASQKGAVGLSYTPWLKKVVNDIFLLYGVGYYKLGKDDNQSISASLHYFSMGDVEYNTMQNSFSSETFSPYEMSFDVGYSRRLTETYSMAVTMRYIRADYSRQFDSDGSADNVFAADIAGYNESYIPMGNSNSRLALGFNISNIGGKISNNGGLSSNFIPTNLRLGGSLEYFVDDVNSLSLSLDFNKLLVPTPPILTDEETSESDTYKERLRKYTDTNSIAGIFKSFAVADGGFSEKLKEIAIAIGAEYDYNDIFKLRMGYFHESKMKGNRRYFTFGTGFKWNEIQLDAAYLLSTVSQNPLDQTLRLSIAYNFASK